MAATAVLAISAVAAAADSPLADSPLADAPLVQLPCIQGITCSKPPHPACAGADLLPAAGHLAAVRRATLCLLNRRRAKRGMRRLHASRPLGRVASRYARQMAAQSFFDHVSPTGSTFVERILRSAYVGPGDGYHIGENLAWGADTLSTPKQIVRAWMRSPGHRANILNRRYRDIGIGIARGIPVAGGDPGATYATEFGALR